MARLTTRLMAGFLNLAAFVFCAPAAAWAICGVDYVAQPGDTLFSIAETHYGDRGHWTLVYDRNRPLLAGATVVPGRKLFLPCAQPPLRPMRRQCRRKRRS